MAKSRDNKTPTELALDCTSTKHGPAVAEYLTSGTLPSSQASASKKGKVPAIQSAKAKGSLNSSKAGSKKGAGPKTKANAWRKTPGQAKGQPKPKKKVGGKKQQLAFEDSSERVSGWDDDDNQYGSTLSTNTPTRAKVKKPTGRSSKSSKVGQQSPSMLKPDDESPTPKRGPRTPEQITRAILDKPEPGTPPSAHRAIFAKDGGVPKRVNEAPKRMKEKLPPPPKLNHYQHCRQDHLNTALGHPLQWLTKEMQGSPNMNKERWTIKNKLLAERGVGNNLELQELIIERRKGTQDTRRSRQEGDLVRTMARAQSPPVNALLPPGSSSSVSPVKSRTRPRIELGTKSLPSSPISSPLTANSRSTALLDKLRSRLLSPTDSRPSSAVSSISSSRSRPTSAASSYFGIR